ncbi:MAG: DNA-processing protein DprA [Cognaticolwellia aestuarii]
MALTLSHYWLALRFVPRLAVVKKFALANTYGIAELFSLSAENLKHIGLNEKQCLAITHPEWEKIERVLAQCEQYDCQLVHFDHSDYPKLLKEIYDPPLVLFVRGDATLLSATQVALVGSRSASINGRDFAHQLAFELASNVVITSGLAIGIDAAAHQGALSAVNGAKTIAVVATGLDRVYPARHKALAQAIVEKGGAIVSEFLPGTQPRAGNFPRRNRLISGLSLGTVVIEAALKSGSLITARCALEQNREVFAVPGAAANPQAKGCHQLIKQGAKLIDSAADILEELEISYSSGHINSVTEKSEKNDEQDLFLDPLLASVGYETTPVDTVVSRSKLPIDEVLTRLTMLELRGLVSAVPGGYLRLNRG